MEIASPRRHIEIPVEASATRASRISDRLYWSRRGVVLCGDHAAAVNGSNAGWRITMGTRARPRRERRRLNFLNIS